MASTPDPVPNLPARRTRAGGLMLALLVLLAALGGGWYGWRHWQHVQARATAHATLRHQALEARVAALRAGQQSQSQRLLQAEATNRVLRDELLGLGQRAALLEDSLSRLADPDRRGSQALRLDELELVLGIGQQRLQLADDIDGALRALALAAPLLDGIEDPAYLNLRQTLAQEQAALQALGPDPRVQAMAWLERIEHALDIAAPAAAPQADAWYRRLLERVVQVQPTASADVRHPAAREVAIAALRVELALARAAAQRRDQHGLRLAVARIQPALLRLLADSPAALARQRGVLAELQALPLRRHSPLAGTTLRQLHGLRGH